MSENKPKYGIYLKSLTDFKGAEVILVDDAELAKLKADKTIQVFGDAAIKVSKPKESKKNKAQQIPWGVKPQGKALIGASIMAFKSLT
jgi:hypothetical protein